MVNPIVRLGQSLEGVRKMTRGELYNKKMKECGLTPIHDHKYKQLCDQQVTGIRMALAGAFLAIGTVLMIVGINYLQSASLFSIPTNPAAIGVYSILGTTLVLGILIYAVASERRRRHENEVLNKTALGRVIEDLKMEAKRRRDLLRDRSSEVQAYLGYERLLNGSEDIELKEFI